MANMRVAVEAEMIGTGEAYVGRILPSSDSVIAMIAESEHRGSRSALTNPEAV